MISIYILVIYNYMYICIYSGDVICWDQARLVRGEVGLRWLEIASSYDGTMEVGGQMELTSKDLRG